MNPHTIDHVADVQPHLPESISFSPQEDFDHFLKGIPAKGAVYLLTDEADRPVQLLCVQNLRLSLKRRLGSDEVIGPTRRVCYRDFVRGIHWRRVDSAFEADWIYYEAARELFPQSYKGMVGFRPAWFVHIDPQSEFPRYVKTIDLSAENGTFLGPFEEKNAAARWIEMIEDAFDLCRFYNILVESPLGKPCAYKEMGKCPAPCDGTIELMEYRSMVSRSLQFVTDPEGLIALRSRAMQEVAITLQFEAAAKIKSHVDRLTEMTKGPFRHVHPLDSFQFISLQRGPREKTAKLFLIDRGQIIEIAGIISEPLNGMELMTRITDSISMCVSNARSRLSTFDVDRIGVVTHHLFLEKQTAGVLLRLDAIDDKTLTKAFRDLQKQKVKICDDEEGLIKELQST